MKEEFTSLGAIRMMIRNINCEVDKPSNQMSVDLTLGSGKQKHQDTGISSSSTSSEELQWSFQPF